MTEDNSLSDIKVVQILTILNSVIMTLSVVAIIMIKYFKGSTCCGNRVMMRSASEITRIQRSDPTHTPDLNLPNLEGSEIVNIGEKL